MKRLYNVEELRELWKAWADTLTHNNTKATVFIHWLEQQQDGKKEAGECECVSKDCLAVAMQTGHPEDKARIMCQAVLESDHNCAPKENCEENGCDIKEEHAHAEIRVEEGAQPCNCACHGKGVVNDCHYLNDDICYHCGGKEKKATPKTTRERVEAVALELLDSSKTNTAVAAILAIVEEEKKIPIKILDTDGWTVMEGDFDNWADKLAKAERQRIKEVVEGMLVRDLSLETVVFKKDVLKAIDS